MAIRKSEANPKSNSYLPTEEQIRLADLAENTLDSLLKLQGKISICLFCTKDSWIRGELYQRYTNVGWNVKFEQSGSTPYYWIDIN